MRNRLSVSANSLFIRIMLAKKKELKVNMASGNDIPSVKKFARTWRFKSSSGVIISTGALIAIIVVIGLLVALSLIGFTNSAGASTFTTTVTRTAIIDSTVTTGAGNSSAFSFNPQQIYASANQSIVTLQGTQLVSSGLTSIPEQILGSGFVIVYNSSFYIVSNYHVAGPTQNLTVTFNDGNSYPASVIGSDPYSDLAIVTSPTAPVTEYHPISVVSSSTLQVGQYVATIGNPFGLSGSMTFGIVSRLGGTISDPTAGNFSIADIIQFSAPINPGNSGGVLLNTNGSVVGITTASVSNSQGVGFAIPSDTILRELPSLISTGKYLQHSLLGISGTDMNLLFAEDSNTNYTYGVLIENVTPGGPASNAGLRGSSVPVTIDGVQSNYYVGGDIIVSANGTRIINNDALATYLVVHTVPGNVLTLGIIRSGKLMNVNVALGERPPLS